MKVLAYYYGNVSIETEKQLHHVALHYPWDLNPLWDADGRFSAIFFTLRKYAYSKILKMLSPKNENFPIKKSKHFHISAQNIDCGYLLEPPRWGDSNEYPQSMILSRNKKNNVYPCKPQFYYIKVGFKENLYRHVIVMTKDTTFLWIPVCFPAHQAPSEKESTLKGILSFFDWTLGSKFFPFWLEYWEQILSF